MHVDTHWVQWKESVQIPVIGEEDADGYVSACLMEAALMLRHNLRTPEEKKAFETFVSKVDVVLQESTAQAKAEAEMVNTMEESRLDTSQDQTEMKYSATPDIRTWVFEVRLLSYVQMWVQMWVLKPKRDS